MDKNDNPIKEAFDAIPDIKLYHVLLALIVFGSLVSSGFVSSISAEKRVKTQMAQIDQCMNYINDYEECWFKVRGGFRISIDNSNKAETTNVEDLSETSGSEVVE